MRSPLVNVRVAQIELDTVAAKMDLSHVVLGTDHPAFADILVLGTNDADVVRELATDSRVNHRFVGYEARAAIDLHND